jgi:hypothetical protein
MADGNLIFESIQKECARRGMLQTPINRLVVTGLIYIQNFNFDEIMGVCLDIHSGYTLKMAIDQAKLQQAERMKNQNG